MPYAPPRSPREHRAPLTPAPIKLDPVNVVVWSVILVIALAVCAGILAGVIELYRVLFG